MAGNDAGHPFQEDFLQTIKEVHWAEEQDFMLGGTTAESTTAWLTKSFDGATWNVNTPPPAPVGFSTVQAISYGNGVWLVGTSFFPSRVYRSTDGGKTWSATSLTGTSILGIAYGKPKGAKTGTFAVLVAGAATGQFDVYTSTDKGLTWSITLSSSDPLAVLTCCCFAGNLFFVGGDKFGGYVYTSRDGIRWSRSSFFSNLANPLACTPQGFAYNTKNKKYAAVAKYSRDESGFTLRFLATGSSSSGVSWGSGTTYGDGGLAFDLGTGPSDTYQVGTPSTCITAGGGVFVTTATKFHGTPFGFTSIDIGVMVSESGDNFSFQSLSHAVGTNTNNGQMNTVNFSKTIKRGKQAGLLLAGGYLTQPNAPTADSVAFVSSDGRSWSKVDPRFGRSFGAGIACSAVGKLAKK